MPPAEPPLTGIDDVGTVVTERCLARPAAVPAEAVPGPGRVGLEWEALPVAPVAGPAGGTTRVPLGRCAEVLGADPAPGTGALTFEPGGQVEHSTAPHPTAAAALAALGAATTHLARLADAAGFALAAVGLDPWHDARGVPQQLDAPRYRAMAAYLATRGPLGHVMMCSTASLQVNLDAGEGTALRRRWAVANLVAPLVTASFASSPVPGAISGRALAWQGLDRTRTGVAAAFVAGEDDPVAAVVAGALAADVLLVRRHGDAVPGRPGWRFADWLRDGHPAFGRPTADDLAYHLTTLFPEVRLRGFLELRGVDALPARWRAVPVVLLAGLLYDEHAGDQVSAVLSPHRRSLPALSRHAARVGVADPALCALAVETWSLALAGARRLEARHPGYFAVEDLLRTEAYLDRFTCRGRAPADELAEHLACGPAAALAWAAEPVGTLTAG